MAKPKTKKKAKKATEGYGMVWLADGPCAMAFPIIRRLEAEFKIPIPHSMDTATYVRGPKRETTYQVSPGEAEEAAVVTIYRYKADPTATPDWQDGEGVLTSAELAEVERALGTEGEAA